MEKTSYNSINIIALSVNYFNKTEDQKNDLQVIAHNRLKNWIQAYAESTGIDMTLEQIYDQQLELFIQRENYAMCQLIKDAAELYNIEL